ncbi:hypothetical protein ACFV2H_14475 [Streptomyces sp. NPDC059629]|uniref:hypothetical protein n=1 Tax=Streptomyces sp. NPDC059629 TaxID=3346889 RepID=UPI00369E449E
MTPEMENAFAAIRSEYGPDSIVRVEEMTAAGKQQRHPLQGGAKWVLPGLSRQPWHDPYGHPELAPVMHALEANHAAIKKESEDAWAMSTARCRLMLKFHRRACQSDWRVR